MIHLLFVLFIFNIAILLSIFLNHQCKIMFYQLQLLGDLTVLLNGMLSHIGFDAIFRFHQLRPAQAIVQVFFVLI